jgi:hypothetical protein
MPMEEEKRALRELRIVINAYEGLKNLFKVIEEAYRCPRRRNKSFQGY